jgi:localization factor PodJL
MSTQFGGGAESGTNGHGDDREADARCRADDLNDLIERMALQLNDADQHQTSALTQMLAKVEALSAEARSYKSKVPQEFLPAFDRIEDVVAQLADRISREHEEHEEPMRTAPGPEHFSEHDDEAVEPAAASVAPSDVPDVPIAPQAEVPARAEAVEQPPLTAQVIDPVMANDEAAWDQQAADALTAHYEHELGNFAADDMPDSDDSAMDAGAAALASALAAPVVPAAQDVKASLLDSERDWLEERFVEIARKVEDSLMQKGSDPALTNLGERFAQLEERFGSALSDVAMRQDIEPLHILEAHIADLAQQFEETRSQLGRLDSIEHSLAAVIDRLTDPRFDDAQERIGDDDKNLEPLFSAAVEQISQRLHSVQLAMPDLEGIAEGIADATAERVASRFADFGSAPQGESNGEDMYAIREMLDQLVNERREGEEQTAAMFDTMQRALIRVLDRVDALEVSSSKAGGADYGRYGIESNAPRVVEPAPMPHIAVSNEPSYEAEADHTESGMAARPFVEAAAKPSASTAPTHQLSSPASIEQLRQDFIADARRAKEKATSATPVAVPGAVKLSNVSSAPANDPAASGVKLGKPCHQAAPVSDADEGDSSLVSRIHRPSRKLLVSAIVLMIAIPGVMLLIKKGRSNAPQPTAIERTEIKPNREIIPVKPAKQTDDSEAASPAEAAPLVKPEANGEKPYSATSKPPKLPPEAAPPDNKDYLYRTNPKTQTRGLGQDVEVPAKSEMPANSAFPVGPLTHATPPSGITVANPRRSPTLAQLERLSERQTLAQLSNQLGEAQVNAVPATLIPAFMYGEDGRPPATATASIPATTASVTAEPAPSTPATTASLSDAHRRPLDLPPAMVGPLSLRLAAANGDPSAEFSVASRFADGNGIKQDLSEAMRWYRRSAARGFAQAQYRVATFYERGLDVKQDNARAKIWYQRAAENGNVKAMHNLAVLSAGRTAKVPDYATAARWFKSAAEHGLADSQFNLAVLHESGLGVARDDQDAYVWFALAARNGDSEALRRQQEMEKAMDAGLLADLKRRVDNWRPKQANRIANDPLTASEAWKAQAAAQGAI